jgi:hypothetical protein
MSKLITLFILISFGIISLLFVPSELFFLGFIGLCSISAIVFLMFVLLIGGHK